MELLFVTSFLAGVLTVLAPCVLPLLPIIVGGSAGGSSRKSVFILIGSLTVSVIAFTLLLRASTLLIDIPNRWWTILSGLILIFFGLITVFPEWWEKLSGGANQGSKKALSSAANQEGWKREVGMGLALGPVFTSCSPTYALIIATVLPASFFQGVLYTTVYALGLAFVLGLIALLGRRLTNHLRGAANPKGWFKRTLGAIFLIVGFAILMGWDKDIEAYIIEQGYFGVTSFEENLVEQIEQQLEENEKR